MPRDRVQLPQDRRRPAVVRPAGPGLRGRFAGARHETGELRPGARRVGAAAGVPVLALSPGDLAGREEARPVDAHPAARAGLPAADAFAHRLPHARLGRGPGPQDPAPRGPRPAVSDAGAAEPRRFPAVGHPVQRGYAAAAARLRHAGRLRLRRVRPARRSSTANCSPTSCCCTWPATSPGSRSQGRRRPRSRATWSSGAPSPPPRANAPSTSSARASPRRSRSSAPASSPTPATRSSALRLANDELRLDDLNRALLRLVYRILFWFVAEDRDALLIPDVSAETPTQLRGRFRGNAGASPRSPRPLPPVLLRCPAAPPGPPAARHPPHRPLRGRPARLRRAWAPKAASPSWPSPASAASSSPAATTAAPSPWTSPWPAPACPTRPSSARSAPWPWSGPAKAARCAASTSATSARRS